MKKSALAFMAMLCVATTLFVGCKDKNDPEPPLPPAPGPTFTDTRDNKVYKIVTIGTQTWMAENLRYQGLDLPAGSDSCYSNLSSNCTSYGTLYTYAGATAAVPPGWHIPSDNEWKTMEKYLGMTQTEADISDAWRGVDEGTKLKEGGSSSLNFKLAGAFYATTTSTFDGLTETGRYWTSTLISDPNYYERVVTSLTPNETKIYRGGRNKNVMMSVRCVKD